MGLLTITVGKGILFLIVMLVLLVVVILVSRRGKHYIDTGSRYQPRYGHWQRCGHWWWRRDRYGHYHREGHWWWSWHRD